MVRPFIAALALLSLCALVPVPGRAAVQVKHLYEAEVPVADQSDGERARALGQALEVVLTRLSGARDFARFDVLAQAVASPARYVQQFRYRQPRGGDGARGEAGPGLVLWARFDPRALEGLVTDSGLPLWGGERPLTLVWLAVEDGTRRYLVGSDTDGEVRREMLTEAARRGLPLVFPLLDLQDQSRVRFADVWGGFFDSIREASQRYGAEAVLVGRLHRLRDGSWRARWSLLNRARETNWSQAPGPLKVVAAEAIDGTADILVSRYAFRPGQGAHTRITLSVEGVHTLQDFARLERYLAARSQVKHLQVVRVQGDGVLYELDILGGVAQLTRSFGLGSVLAPSQELVPSTDSPGGTVSLPQTLGYRLVP